MGTHDPVRLRVMTATVAKKGESGSDDEEGATSIAMASTTLLVLKLDPLLGSMDGRVGTCHGGVQIDVGCSVS